MTERKTDYETGNVNGMSFICNRWTFTGPQGFRVKRDMDGTFYVVSFAHTTETHVWNGAKLTEDKAHNLAASLAHTTPHPKPVED